MGFYGNVTDTSHIHFQFDKIFPNRLSMDQALQYGTDGIFAGRFVLVKYNPEGNYPFYRFFQGYQNSEASGEAANYLYHDRLFQHPFIYTTFTRVNSPRAENWEQYYTLVNNRYIALQNAESFVSNGTYYTPSASGESHIVGQNDIIQLKSVTTGELLKKFYKCTLSTNNGRSGQPAIWEEIISDVSYGDYFVNYNIDSEAYADQFDSRGYDATVWQKVYSEGNGKFVLIAHLNGGYIPSFELFADPPSQSPEAPYIDSKSTDALYRVHVPSHWGLKFKEDDPVEDGGLSEQKVSYEKRNYAQDGSNSYTTEQTTIDAEIYFNKQAADKTIRSNDQDTNNEILLEPTGRSGKTYTNNQQAIDTLELSVHLPFVGNAVSDMYDLIYDYDHTAEAPQMRYTDTSWITGEKPDSVKYNGPQGEKTHNLSTVAGTINTMHDRLGQIIVPLDKWINPEDAEYDVWIASLNGSKCIYSYQTNPTDPPTYYRISEDATYQDLPNGTFRYVPIDFANNTAAYAPNTFYYLDSPFNNNVNAILYESQPSHATAIASLLIDTNGTYTARPNRYYYKKSIAEIAYTPIDLEFYQPDKFFLKQGTSYFRDRGINGPNATTNAPTNPYAQYYYIDESNTNLHRYRFTNGYVARSDFYYQEPGTTNYRWAIEDYPNGATQYFTTIQEQVFEQQEVIVYKKNVLYYSVGTNSQQYYLMEDNTYQEFRNNHRLIVADETFKVYWLEFEDTPILTLTTINGVQQTVLSYPVKPGGAHQITAPIVDMFTEAALQQEYATLLSNHPGMEATYKTLFFRDEDNNYISYENLEHIPPLVNGTPYYATPRAYYMIAIAPQTLYIPGRYYSRTPDNTTGDYSISWDTWSTSMRNTNFYIIDEIISVDKPFYEPNTYYYKDSTNADFSTTTDQTAAYYQNHTYHTYYAAKQKLYVESDSSGRCPEGYEWNEDSMFIPASIILKALSKRLVLIPMEGFDNGASSLNGALLRMSQEYCPESKTRDVTTFRGGLNKLSDLLYTISKLTPGKVVYVNDFGQLTTGDLSYAQLAALVT